MLERHEQRLAAAVDSVAAHPELSSLYGILNCVVELAISDTSTAGSIDTMQRARSAVSDTTHSAVQCAVETLLTTGVTTMCVLSHSGTVNRVFELLRQQNIQCHVLCAESRPLFEGRATAKCMACMGHNVVLCSDAQIAGLVTTDCVVVL
jgi:translation initiation factor 2B subunit (eIF-2B alpha/beta/delta family)